MSKLPAGWRIERVWRFDHNYSEDFYVVQKWGTWIRRRFLRKPVERVGWGRVYEATTHEAAAQYIFDTVAAQEAVRDN